MVKQGLSAGTLESIVFSDIVNKLQLNMVFQSIPGRTSEGKWGTQTCFLAHWCYVLDCVWRACRKSIGLLKEFWLLQVSSTFMPNVAVRVHALG